MNVWASLPFHQSHPFLHPATVLLSSHWPRPWRCWHFRKMPRLWPAWFAGTDLSSVQCLADFSVSSIVFQNSNTRTAISRRSVLSASLEFRKAIRLKRNADKLSAVVSNAAQMWPHRNKALLSVLGYWRFIRRFSGNIQEDLKKSMKLKWNLLVMGLVFQVSCVYLRKIAYALLLTLE